MTDERLAWLRQQIDDDERVARQLIASPGGFFIEAETEDTDHMAACAHVLRWSPARVLRKVEAMRGVLAMYETQQRGLDENTQTVVKMHLSPRMSDPNWGAEFGQLRMHGWHMEGRVTALRMVIRELAVEYADRPGYQEMWGEQ